MVNRSSNRYLILFVVAMGHFLIPFMLTSINIALPAIGEDLAMDAVALNWVATVYLLSSAMFLIPFGKVADIYGRKKIFTYGFIIYILTSILSANAYSSTALLSFRFLQGIGAAMIFSTGVAILTSVTTLTERGKTLGIAVAMVYIGQSVGPFLGGVLTQHFGWRSIFYANVPICLIVVIIILFKIKEEWVEVKGERFNYCSAIIYSISFLLILYGLSNITERNGMWLMLTGAVCLFYFFWHEQRVNNPLLNIRLLINNRVFAFSSLATLINYSATYAVVFLLSLYLQYIKMLTPQDAGLILMSKAIIQGAISPISGHFSDHFDPGKLSSAGMGLTALALFLFSFLCLDTSLKLIIGIMFILGLGIGMFVSPNSCAIMSSVESECYGIASSTIATMRLTGQLLSMAIVMILFIMNIGRVEINPQSHDAFLLSLKYSFLIFSFLCLIGICFSVSGNLRKGINVTDRKI